MGKCAIEVTGGCLPWDKAQVVVMLSRTRRGEDIIIVCNNIEKAIDMMWKAITRGNQWMEYEEHLIERLSINPSTQRPNPRKIDYSSVFPFRTCDIPLPNDDTGFVYMLISVRDVSRTYVGQTKNIDRRFKEHNSGYGAEGTANTFYRPYCMGGYICGMANVTPRGRIALERRWKNYIESISNRGDYNVMSRLEQGERIVQEYNERIQEHNNHPENLLQFVYTIEHTALGRLPTSTPALENSLNNDSPDKNERNVEQLEDMEDQDGILV